MFFDANLHIEIAGRAAVTSRFALAVQANPIAGIHAGGNLDRGRLFLANPSLSVAAVARVGNDLAAAFAARTGLLDGEYRLLDPHLSLAIAGVAGLGCRAFGSAGNLAGFALAHGRYADLGLDAENRFFQLQLEFVAQIGAAKHLRAAALAPGENIAEHLPEDVAERVAGAEAAAVPFKSGMPE